MALRVRYKPLGKLKARQAVVCYAKKPKTVDLSNIVAQLSQGAILVNCNITTSSKESYDKVLDQLGATPSTTTNTNKKFGGGSLGYTGCEWLNGSIYAGINSNSTYIIRFTGRVGQEKLVELCKQGSMEECLNSFTCNQVCYQMLFQPIAGLENLTAWTNECVACGLAPKQFKGSIFIENQTLKVGQTTSVRSLTLTPVVTSLSTIAKFIVSVTLQSSASLQFFNTLRSNSGTFDSYCAFDLLQFLNLLPNTAVFAGLTDLLNKTHKVGGVFVKAQPKKDLLVPTELKNMKAGCTAIVNKLVSRNYTDPSKLVFIEHCIKIIYNRRSEISNYDQFIEVIKKELRLP